MTRLGETTDPVLVARLIIEDAERSPGVLVPRGGQTLALCWAVLDKPALDVRSVALARAIRKNGLDNVRALSADIAVYFAGVIADFADATDAALGTFTRNDERNGE